jgi:signal-transduction protein with cAMP-binding, CBS, and nucleotidyltransferase domain
MGSRTIVFRQLARDFMKPVPLSVRPETPIKDVIGRMAAGKASCAVVTAPDGGHGVGGHGVGGAILGILTEQDVIRRIAFEATPETPVRQLMTEPVRTIAADDYLYHAIARMRRFGHRHMPVIDSGGALVGLLDLEDAQAAAASRMMEQIDRLTHEGTIDGLVEIKAAQVDLAEDLFADNVPTPEIQALLTDVNNDIYRRVVEAALREVAEEGRGEPPVDFAVIVMGSGGRGENFLFPDQDNGFILADYPDSEHDRIDGFFTELAARMTRDLDRVGFPLCKGYVMATNPLWRKTLSQWRAQTSLWGRRRNAVMLRLADIFFDFVPVFGHSGMAAELRRHVTAIGKGNHAFLLDMYRDDSEAGVGLGLFGRFITERKDKAHKGKISLKHAGAMPLVEAARLLALREGIDATSTLGRLAALHKAGILDADEHDYLRGAFSHITRLLLRQQMADFKAGKTVGNYVSPKALSRREKDLLVDSFKAIRALRKRIRADFTGEIF